MKGFSAGGGRWGGGAPGPPLAAIISKSGSSCSAEAISSAADATARPKSLSIKSRSMSSSKAPPCPQWNSSPKTSRFFLKRYATCSSNSLARLWRAIFSSRFVAGSSASSGFRSMARASSLCAIPKRWQSAAKPRQQTKACRNARARSEKSRVAASTSPMREGTSKNFKSAVLTSSNSSFGENKRSCPTRLAIAFNFPESSSKSDCCGGSVSALRKPLTALYAS
mmetsp:Transcript_118188/g.294846  ORF Transcript_118188/g.294846 Transcript_118188/m.294846 type:complete len:224 (-) Transcript_118188:189-860(-)